MGRVTVFTDEDCGSQLVRKILDENDIPYSEISLSNHPDRRVDMIKLTKSITTPQVFFNIDYIGGCQQMKNVLECYKQESKFSGYSTIKERITIEVLDVQMQHVHLLRLSPTQPSRDSLDERRKQSQKWRYNLETYDELTLLNSEKTTITQVTRDLKSWLRTRTKSVPGTVERRFLGSDVKIFLMHKYGFDVMQSLTFAEKLLTLGVIHCMSEWMAATSRFTEKAFYSLQQCQCPNIINSFRIWSKELKIENFSPDPTPFLTVSNLMKSLSAVLVSMTSSQGDINFKSARNSTGYERFQEEVAYLQLVNLEMTDLSKRAFFINIYNLMISHLFVELNPKTMTSDLFCNFYYNVGGYLLSLDDIYHGILRGNAKHPLSGKKVFGKKDERKQLILSKIDPRIHFALNNSSGGCIPGYEFHSVSLRQELHVMAKKKCSKDQSIVVDDVFHKVVLPYFFKTYFNDFVRGKRVLGLPGVLLNYLEGQKREQLDRMMRVGNTTRRKIIVEFRKSYENDKNEITSKNGIKCALCAFFPWNYTYSKIGTPLQPSRVDQKSTDSQRLLRYESSCRSNFSSISKCKFSDKAKSFNTFEGGMSSGRCSVEFFKIDTHIISDSGGEWADFNSIDFPPTPTKLKMLNKQDTPLTSTETPDTDIDKRTAIKVMTKVNDWEEKFGSDEDSDEVTKPEVSKPPDSRRLDFEIELMDELFPSSADQSLRGRELFPEDADYSQFEGSLAESDLISNNINEYIGDEKVVVAHDNSYSMEKSLAFQKRTFSEASF